MPPAPVAFFSVLPSAFLSFPSEPSVSVYDLTMIRSGPSLLDPLIALAWFTRLAVWVVKALLILLFSGLVG